MNYSIRNMTKDDWLEVSNIYKEGIDTKTATFQSEIPTCEQWDSSHLNICRFVITAGNKIVGWSALSPTSSRCVYKGVAEVSIYISNSYKGQGLGKILLDKMIMESEKNNIWSLQSVIIRENLSSIKLHEKCGFRQIGIREKVAKMDTLHWMDVVLMERRSKIIGID